MFLVFLGTFVLMLLVESVFLRFLLVRLSGFSKKGGLP